GGRLFQGAGQCCCQRHRHGAAVPPDRDQRPVIARVKKLFFDRGFKLIIVGNNQPIRVTRSREKFFRNRLARCPDLHWSVVDRVADAQHLGSGIGRVTPSAAAIELRSGTCFNIAKQYGHDAGRPEEKRAGATQPSRSSDAWSKSDLVVQFLCERDGFNRFARHRLLLLRRLLRRFRWFCSSTIVSRIVRWRRKRGLLTTTTSTRQSAFPAL